MISLVLALLPLAAAPAHEAPLDLSVQFEAPSYFIVGESFTVSVDAPPGGGE